jgi:hypothetical protein
MKTPLVNQQLATTRRPAHRVPSSIPPQRRSIVGLPACGETFPEGDTMRTAMMTNERSGATHLRVLLVAGALMLLAALAPHAVRAETEEAGWKECMDHEWADYNSCLLNSGTAWERKLCDIYFEAGVVLCGAKYVGEVKKAAGGSDSAS